MYNYLVTKLVKVFLEQFVIFLPFVLVPAAIVRLAVEAANRFVVSVHGPQYTTSPAIAPPGVPRRAHLRFRPFPLDP